MDWLSNGAPPPAIRRAYGSGKTSSSTASVRAAASTFIAVPPAPVISNRRADFDDAAFYGSSSVTDDDDWRKDMKYGGGDEDFSALLASARAALARSTTTKNSSGATGRLSTKKRLALRIARKDISQAQTTPPPPTNSVTTSASSTARLLSPAPLAAASVVVATDKDSDSDSSSGSNDGGIDTDMCIAEVKATFRRLSVAPHMLLSRRSTLSGIQEQQQQQQHRASILSTTGLIKDESAPILVKKITGGPARRVRVIECVVEETTAAVTEVDEEVEEKVDTTPTHTLTTTTTIRAFDTALTAILDFLPTKDLLHITPRVAKAWAAASPTVTSLRASAAAINPNNHLTLPKDPTALLESFPFGTYLASGACKRVYRVWSAARVQWEAVAVIDARALAGAGRAGAAIIAGEVATSVLTAHLVRARIAPHFVLTHQVFLHANAPVEKKRGLWNSGWDAWGKEEEEGEEGSGSRGSSSRDVCPWGVDLPSPTAARAILKAATSSSASSNASGITEQRALISRARAGLARLARDTTSFSSTTTTTSAATPTPRLTHPDASYLFIRMELCTGGDAENFLKGLEVNTIRSDISAGAWALSLAWQLCFALFSARDRLSLRHFDIKLLNVLLALPKTSQATSLLYIFGERHIVLKLGSDEESGLLAKLSDWGTASTDAVAAVTPPFATSSSWTTLENSPPEFFLSSDDARAGWGPDSWALGLSLLHSLLGIAPYEEAMVNVTAPKVIREALLKVWKSGNNFRVLRAVCDGDTVTYTLLADTLWRFAILIGPPSLSVSGGTIAMILRSAANCLEEEIASSVPIAALPSRSTRGRSTKASTTTTTLPLSTSSPLSSADLSLAQKAWVKDSNEWALATGTAPVLLRARQRAETGAKGLWSLITSFLSWNPSTRPTMRAALSHVCFNQFEKVVSDVESCTFDKYDAYEGRIESLPNV